VICFLSNFEEPLKAIQRLLSGFKLSGRKSQFVERLVQFLVTSLVRIIEDHNQRSWTQSGIGRHLKMKQNVNGYWAFSTF